MTDHIGDLAAFIAASPSSFHAAHEAASRLDAAGFARLDESAAWPSDAGRRYVVRDGAIIAWVQPRDATGDVPFRVIGTHTDSPGFKLKPRPSTAAHGFLQAGVEVYGGPLLNSWLDRELEFAGRLVTIEGDEHLVRTGPFLRFPQLAIHLDRGVNDGLRLDPQQHMNPVYGMGEASTADVVGHLAKLAGIHSSDVAGYDIVVADTAPGAVFGINGEFFAAGRMDNLVSVHAGLRAIEQAQLDAPHISVFAAFDHEEVGSATRSGAAGPFLEDVLARISDGMNASVSDRLRAFSRSWCFSADAGHSVHPNYAERHDPVNRPVMGGGPLLKINAQQRYATDAQGAAEWARACAAAGVRYQEFVSNNTVPCGSTIGPLTATRLGIRTVDIGVALLSMHSARELCAVGDPEALAAVLTAFVA